MSFRLWEIFKDPDKRAVISWLGGGAVVVAGGIWTVLAFVVEHKEARDKDGRQTGQVVAEAERPLLERMEKLAAEKAELTLQLEQARKGPQPPGAQQALGAAVGSIVQGAAEGDSRLQKALGLLRESKITEASQLLRAFAGDKEARAEQATEQVGKDRKEAALAYRNLGAIAGLADPKRALEAYEKAIALDPDDTESLYCAGALQIDYGDLAKAQTRLERALGLAKTEDQAWCKYCALNSLGDIKQRRGDLEGALKSYNDGLAFAERLAKPDPGNAEWQRDLSMSYGRIGGVQKAQGNLAGALKSYSGSLAIIERLAQSEPGNAEWQRDLSVAYNNIGSVQEAQGELQAALKSYSDSLAIISLLAKPDPGNAEWQRDLSISYGRIGGVQKAQGNLADALKSYSDSLAIIERLAQSDPGNAEWQRDLAVSFGELALAHKQSGDDAKALDFLRQGQAIMARLTKLSPDNATWKQDLARFDRDIAALAPLRPEHGRNPRTPLSRR